MARIKRLNKNTIKIAYWNVNRGFLTKGKIYEVEEQMNKLKVDIIALAEVEITDTTYHMDGLYEIKGYSFEYPNAWKKYGRARTMVYMKKNLEKYVKIRRDLMTEDQPDIWLELKVPESSIIESSKV